MNLLSRHASIVTGLASIVAVAAVSLGCPGGSDAHVVEVDATSVLQQLIPSSQVDSTYVGDTIRTRNFDPVTVRGERVRAHIAWTTSNPAVVRIAGPTATIVGGFSADTCCATLVPTSEGDAVITGTITDLVKTATGSPLTYRATVSVAGAPAALKISPSASQVMQIAESPFSNLGAQFRPRAQLTSASGRAITSNLRVRWAILDGDAAQFRDVLTSSFLSSSVVLPLDSFPTIFGMKPGVVRLTATLEPQAGRTVPALSAVVQLTVGGGQVVVSSTTPQFGDMEIGDSQQFTTQIKDIGGTTITPLVLWTSSRPSIATTDQTGKLTAISAAPDGDTLTLVASVPLLGITGRQTVRVLRKVATLTLSPSPVTLGVGGFRVVTARFLDGGGNLITRHKALPTWAISSGADVVSFYTEGSSTPPDSLAVLQGTKAGTATLRVTYGAVVATAPVTVTPPAASTLSLTVTVGGTTRTVSSATEALLVGSALTLTGTAKDANGAIVIEPLTFAAAPAAPVTVTPTTVGVATVTGAAPGTTTITVSSSSDPTVRATVTIVVSPVPTGGPAVRVAITSTPGTGIASVGGTVQYVGVPKDAAGNTASDCAVLGWATDRSAVGSITSGGLASGSGQGTTAVRAFCADNGAVSGSARLVVVDGTFGVSQLNITPRFFYVPASTLSRTAQFSATLVQSAPGLLSPIVWSLVQTPVSVATIDQTGKVTIPPSTGASFAGSVRVVATSAGQSDTSWVTYGAAGSITGRLVSTSGTYLGGATARVIPTGGGADVKAGVNNEGVFYLTGLAPGSYTVEVQLQGNPVTQNFAGVIVTTGGTTLLPLTPFP